MAQNGPAIRAIRKRARLTQVQLAHEAGINQSYLSLLESGRRSASNNVITAIADALGVPPEILRRPEQEAS